MVLVFIWYLYGIYMVFIWDLYEFNWTYMKFNQQIMGLDQQSLRLRLDQQNMGKHVDSSLDLGVQVQLFRTNQYI